MLLRIIARQPQVWFCIPDQLDFKALAVLPPGILRGVAGIRVLHETQNIFHLVAEQVQVRLQGAGRLPGESQFHGFVGFRFEVGITQCHRIVDVVKFCK